MERDKERGWREIKRDDGKRGLREIKRDDGE